MAATREELYEEFKAHYGRRDYLKAFQSARGMVDLNARDAVGWRSMGETYLALGQEADARESFRTALELNPKDAFAYQRLGVLAVRAEQDDEAIHLFEKAMELAPAMFEAALGLGSIYLKMGDLANALYYYSQAYQAAPDNAEVMRNLGVALLQAGQLSKAAYYLRKAVELKPDWAEPHLELGETLRRMGEDRDAAAELLTGLRVKQRPDGLVSLSRIHLKYREPRKALVHLHRALELAPEFAAAHHVLGLAHAALGELPPAIRELDLAYRYAPDNMEIVLDLAGVMVQADQDLDRAFRLAAAVRVMDPNQVRVYDIMGWCLFKKGQLTEALAELEKARSLMELKDTVDPVFAAVYEHLAEVYGRLRDSMMAREMFSRALAADPSRAEEWKKRAQTFGGTLA